MVFALAYRPCHNILLKLQLNRKLLLIHMTYQNIHTICMNT